MFDPVRYVVRSMALSIAIVDDHHLVAAALSDLIRKFEQYEVMWIAENGRDLFLQLADSPSLPDIALVDVNMPVMNGFETADQLRKLYPAVRVLALSMEDREEQIVRMVRNGARGYLLKDCRPSELRRALDELMTKGYYHTEFLTAHLMNNLSGGQDGSSPFNLNERELEFLRLACSDLTYAGIAEKMFVSPRTVDGYREVIFQRMNVKTRVGMVIQAIRHGLIDVGSV